MSFRKRSGVMLAYPYEEKRLLKWEPPYIIQPKLDGERGRLIVEANRAILLSSTEEIITSVPHINKYASEILPPGEWDGELYIHGKTFEEIHSIVSRTVNLHPDYETMQFHIFDHVCAETMLERQITLLKLRHALNDNAHFKVVDSYIAYDTHAAEYWREHIMNQNYEGFIIRHAFGHYTRSRSTLMMKFKPKKFDAYEIIGFREEHDIQGNPKNCLGRFICRGSDGTPFDVYSGISNERRHEYWQIRDSLIGQYLKVGYQNLTTKNGVPRSGCFVALITPAEAREIERHQT